MTEETEKTETIRETRDRLFVHYVSLELGIIPMEEVSNDVRRALNNLPPEESRKMKRKFRKLWRKYAKDELNKPSGFHSDAWRRTFAKNTLGLGARQPSRAQKYARKQLVSKRIWHDFIKPMLKRFERIQT